MSTLGKLAEELVNDSDTFRSIDGLKAYLFAYINEIVNEADKITEEQALELANDYKELKSQQAKIAFFFTYLEALKEEPAAAAPSAGDALKRLGLDGPVPDAAAEAAGKLLVPNGLGGTVTGAVAAALPAGGAGGGADALPLLNFPEVPSGPLDAGGFVRNIKREAEILYKKYGALIPFLSAIPTTDLKVKTFIRGQITESYDDSVGGIIKGVKTLMQTIMGAEENQTGAKAANAALNTLIDKFKEQFNGIMKIYRDSTAKDAETHEELLNEHEYNSPEIKSLAEQIRHAMSLQVDYDQKPEWNWLSTEPLTDDPPEWLRAAATADSGGAGAGAGGQGSTRLAVLQMQAAAAPVLQGQALLGEKNRLKGLIKGAQAIITKRTETEERKQQARKLIVTLQKDSDAIDAQIAALRAQKPTAPASATTSTCKKGKGGCSLMGGGTRRKGLRKRRVTNRNVRR